MSQPFIGDMATESERPQLLGTSTALFYIGSVLSLLVIWGVLNLHESTWVLTVIITVGACLGVTSTHFIRQMDESPAMIRAARKKLLPEMRKVMQINELRKLLFAMFTTTLSLMMLGAVSMLSVKRGYGISDTAALYFSLVQFLSCSGISFLSGKLVKRIGAQKTIFASFGTMLAVSLLWMAAPAKMSYIYCTLIFITVGSAHVVCTNALTAYYLQVTPAPLRVAASMVTSVVTSVLAGLTGMVLSSTIFKIIDKVGAEWEPLNRFKVYFAVALSLLLVLSTVVWRLPQDRKSKN